MSYELTIDLKGGRLEVEADTPAQLERRIRALDLARIEGAIAEARRRTAPPSRAATGRRARRQR